MLRDYENQSQNSQVNDTNFAAVVSYACDSKLVFLKQEECDLHVSDDTAENCVENTAQSNPKGPSTLA